MAQFDQEQKANQRASVCPRLASIRQELGLEPLISRAFVDLSREFKFPLGRSAGGGVYHDYDLIALRTGTEYTLSIELTKRFGARHLDKTNLLLR